MFRLLVYVALVFLISAGLAWLADRPGDLVLHWQGYEIKTSLMIAALAIAAVFAVLAIVWIALRALVRAPRSFESYLGRRRRDRGYKALTDGMIAVGAGDAKAAHKAATQSRTLLGAEPLPLLLSAQAAQLAGDGVAAKSAFEELASENQTKILGLHGLFIEARRQNEHEAARHFAEQAAEAAPKIGWAGEALFEYRSRAGEWLGAMQVLESNIRAGVIDKTTARGKRAALLTARAMELEAGLPNEARAAAQEAHRLAPDLVPAAVVASRLLSRNSDFRRAARVLETTWKVNPHPDIADAYATVRPGDSVRDRLKRMRRLADLRANHPEGAMAVARAAIDAHDWSVAREALDGPAKAEPSESVCLLMAEIEERENADQGRVRMWLARAINAAPDPVWMADGQIFDHWAPVSPVSGHVGVFAWAVPSEVPQSRVALEIEADFAAEPQAVEVAAGQPMIEDQSQAADPEVETPEAETIEAAAIVEPDPALEESAAAEAAPGQAPPVETKDISPASEEGEPPQAAEPPKPESEPPSTAAPPPVASNGTRSVAKDVEEPPKPPLPDDPGPAAVDDTPDEQPRRFRLFS